jgi:hypothetical protein
MSLFPNPLSNLLSSNTNPLTTALGMSGGKETAGASKEAEKDLDKASAATIRENTRTKIEQQQNETKGAQGKAHAASADAFKF